MIFRFLLHILLVIAAFIALSITPVFALTERWVIVNGQSITAHRMHSVTHPNVRAKNMYMAFITGLDTGCDSVFLYPDEDPFLYTAVMSAFSDPGNRKFHLYYAVDESLRGPWGDSSSCPLTSFTERFD